MADLRARRVRREDLGALFRLKVRAEQADQVAPNEITIAQAAYEPGAYVWGLWEGDTPVGLLAMVNPKELRELTAADDLDAAYIWRLMIDQAHQGRGLGRQAVDLARQQAAAWGLPRVSLTFVDKPGGAEPFYLACGFRRTGRVIDGEVEMIREV